MSIPCDFNRPETGRGKPISFIPEMATKRRASLGEFRCQDGKCFKTATRDRVNNHLIFAPLSEWVV